MPNLNDYHAFKSTCGGSGSGGFSSGCLKLVLTIVVIVLVLCLIGQCSS